MQQTGDKHEHVLTDTTIKIAAGAGGGAIGGLIGLLIAGPPGAVVGGAAGSAIVPLAEQIALSTRRALTRREEQRTITVLQAAAIKIEKNLRANLKLRDDGFLSAQEHGYSSGDIVCEAVIRAAEKEHEEKKIRFQGNLLGNIPFYPLVNQSTANLLVRLASELSYQQYCLLSLFCRTDEFDLAFKYQTQYPWKVTNYSDPPEQVRNSERLAQLQAEEREAWLAEMTEQHHTVRQEAYALYARALLRTNGESGEGKLIVVNHFMYDKVYAVNVG